MSVSQRRKVHNQPLDQLEIPKLRKAILHTLKLDRKWSGKEDVDPGPVRTVTLDTTPFSSGDNKSVTWAWFLEDGEHIICVVDDRMVQIWHIPSNKPVLSFNVRGQMLRASKYINGDEFVLAASVSWTGQRNKQRFQGRDFNVWKQKLEPQKPDETIKPFISIPIPVDASFVIITDTLAGLLYVSSPNESIVDDTGYHIQTGDLCFIMVDWHDRSRMVRFFTPAHVFGPDNYQRCRDENFRTVRTPGKLILHFESTLAIQAYSYNLADFHEHVASSFQSRNPIRIEPTLEVKYKFDHKVDMGGLPNTPWRAWGDACLWDKHRIGLLSQSLKLVDGEPYLLVTMSILQVQYEPSSNDMQDGRMRIETRFTRPLVHLSPHDTLTRTPENHILVSQPKGSKNVLWALHGEPDGVNSRISQLALGQFPSMEEDDRGRRPEKPLTLHGNESESESKAASGTAYDHDAPVTQRGKIIYIDVAKWITEGEIPMDIDLDDCLGRVALGMKSGKVLILEFVNMT